VKVLIIAAICLCCLLFVVSTPIIFLLAGDWKMAIIGLVAVGWVIMRIVED